MIEQFIKQFTEKKIENIVKIRNNYFLAGAELVELHEKIAKNNTQDPILLGKFMGEEKRNQFKPSIALLDEIHPLTDKTLVVDDKAEWLFLCGRDMFGKAIVESKADKGVVLVENKKHELLGYGKIINRFTEKNKVVVKNILDRGDFLRRER